MNLRNLNTEQPVQFERIRVVSGLNGPMPEIAVLGGPVQVGLGKKSW
jgi:hypothetical protein